MKTKHVYLGRFAPFHNGHRLLLSKLISEYEVGNVLVLIGSTNTLNKRTPYTFEARKKIIGVSFPEVEILPLPDGKPNLEYFDGSTNSLWLDNIERIARERGEKYIFYGGDSVDLAILSERFETKVIVSREIIIMSATKVREMIRGNDLVNLTEAVDPKAIELIISEFKSDI